MSIDPSDGRTFWYTNESLASNGTVNWHTRIASFKFPGCNAQPSDFSISANPTSLSVAQGAQGTSTISTAVTSGAAQSGSLGATGLPSGATASFRPPSGIARGSSTITLSVGPRTAPPASTLHPT